ncbi:MAG: hypothetical protein EVG15_02345 [Candidatus Acididesulfobacter diazotrophicus]|jgi:hypothetical protein|uniref:Uncharacterized protein n=1 Tax=Candidatus Acididesulfobacter diazotrophicus TaxID=2597226 RepID=A0A519BPT3_9DELT|nr:MAG: hypothetical protein EVG15_02345 [Candidatus Acididesulfobacter diazotrophicus]
MTYKKENDEMEIIIDGNKIDFTPNTSETVYDFLINKIRDFIPKNMVIKEIFLDDKKYDDLMIDDEKAKTFKLTSNGTLKINTMTSDELVMQSLNSIESYFSDLLKNLGKVADLLREGNDKEGFTDFAADLKGIGAFVQVMDKIALFLNIDYSTYKYKERSIKDYFDDTEKLLSNILETQKTLDYVMLADLIDFEMEPLIKTWKEVILTLKSDIGNGK